MQGEKPDWIVVPATVNYIRSENGYVYPSCNGTSNGRPCQKKLQDGAGRW
jgi:hypothetical protein